MGSREPLGGWRGDDNGSVWSASLVEMSAMPSGYWRVGGRFLVSAPSFAQSWGAGAMHTAQLAAEDAARAMVADMAAALGGSVTWATEGGE